MKRTLSIVIYLCIVLAYGFLIQKVFTYKNYVELLEGVVSFSSFSLACLLFLFLLLPVNIFVEALKWKELVAPVYKLSVLKSVKSVLVGVVGALSTPNKIGDFPLRTLFMPKEIRVAATIAGFVGSWIQIMVISFFGLISFVLLIKQEYLDMANVTIYVYVVLVVLIVLGVFFLLMPSFSKCMLKKITSVTYISNIFKALQAINQRQFFVLLLLTVFRYCVFSFQFYLALSAFGVSLSIEEALLSIPAMYLLISIAPSFVVSDLIVRTSFSIMIIGVFSDNILAISLASTLVWVVNCLLPMVVGSVLAFYATVKS